MLTPQSEYSFFPYRVGLSGFFTGNTVCIHNIIYLLPERMLGEGAPRIIRVIEHASKVVLVGFYMELTPDFP